MVANVMGEDIFQIWEICAIQRLQKKTQFKKKKKKTRLDSGLKGTKDGIG